MNKYMIHSCDKRLWYVRDFLIPSMLRQGISRNDIILWNDASYTGNFRSFKNSMSFIANNLNPDDATWHIQDDVFLSEKFRWVCENVYDGVAYGFWSDCGADEGKDNPGWVTVDKSWTAFPCVRIPNSYAQEFLDWYKQNCGSMAVYAFAKTNRGDDIVFNFFLQDMHHDEQIYNIYPNIVEHIDYLLGGSTVYKERTSPVKSEYWYEGERTELLKRHIEEYKKRNDQV